MAGVRKQRSLTERERDLLRLIARTPSDDTGWKPVSEMCCSLFDGITLPADLFEFELLDGGGRARLTDAGNVLVAYL